MAKIQKLTPDQAARLVTFRAEWHAWGVCTERADRAKAEAAILAMRARIGVAKKPVFVWCQSPATMALAAHTIKTGDSLWDSLRDSLGASLWDSLRDSLGDSLWDSLRDSLRDSLADSLRDSLRDSLADSLRDSLGDSLRDSLRDSLWDSLADSLRASLRDSLWGSLWTRLGASLRASLRASLGDTWWGQMESYWIAHHLFCRDVLHVQYDPVKSADLDLWRDVAQSCCWWLCYENVVLISERPTIVKMDDREVLHAEHGPALAFADGWSVYAWHGTRIPAEWIENKDSLTPAIALKTENLEQRRAACEILGWNHILTELNARTINSDADETIGTLVEVDLPDSGPERFLRVVCGTGRRFAIPVPPTVQSAIEANAWTYGLSASEYTPEFRT